MPDELAGQGTPVVPNEVPNTEPAQPNAGTDAPGAETEGVEKETQNEPKTITLTEEEMKDRIERATAKASAKAERRALRQANEILMQTVGRQSQTNQQPTEDARPNRQQFASEEAYEDAVYDWRRSRDDRAQQSKAQEDQHRSNGARAEKIYSGVEKLTGMDRDDIDEAVINFTPVIAQTLMESEISEKLMAHLITHQEELQRIKALSPARQAAEIGKLETRLANVAKPPRTPAPIEPVGGGQSPTKSLSNMSPQEYYEARLKQRPHWAR